jgi:hypothetical protein
MSILFENLSPHSATVLLSALAIFVVDLPARRRLVAGVAGVGGR